MQNGYSLCCTLRRTIEDLIETRRAEEERDCRMNEGKRN